jgi:hypothetical protein
MLMILRKTKFLDQRNKTLTELIISECQISLDAPGAYATNSL